MSGSTTGSVIAELVDKDWIGEYGIKTEEWVAAKGKEPLFEVYALNSCLTKGEDLEFNATVLSYQLAKALNKCHHEIAYPNGLSAPLIASSLIERRKFDEHPQTKEVIEKTQPSRLGKKPSDDDFQGYSGETSLDIVLTSVGQGPPMNSDNELSLFWKLAVEYGIETKEFTDKRIVGDLVYQIIFSNGDPVSVSGKQEDGGGEFMLYSAIELSVLETMAKDPTKEVIMVARNAKNKIPALHASIGGDHLYASKLILDQITASELNRY